VNDAADGPGLVSDFLVEYLNDADFYVDEALRNVEEVKDDLACIARGVARRQVTDRDRPGAFVDPDELQRSNLLAARQELRCAGEQLGLLAVLVASIDGVAHALLSRHVRARAARFFNGIADKLLGSRRAALKLPDALMEAARFRPRDLLLSFAAVLGPVAAAGPRCGAEPGAEGGSRWASRGGAAGGGGGVSGAGGAGGVGGDNDDDILVAALVGATAFDLAAYGDAPRILLGSQAGGRGAERQGAAQRAARQLHALHRRLAAGSGRAGERERLIGAFEGAGEDKCQCPLSCDLLDDPVLLPVSRTIVSRKAIEQQLLEREVDPYSNAPLRAADLVELPALREAVRAWVGAKLAGRDGAAELPAVERESVAAVEAAAEAARARAAAESGGARAAAEGGGGP